MAQRPQAQAQPQAFHQYRLGHDSSEDSTDSNDGSISSEEDDEEEEEEEWPRRGRGRPRRPASTATDPTTLASNPLGTLLRGLYFH